MTSIQPQRVRRLGPDGDPAGGDFVLYWMQAAVRTTANHALEFASERANQAGVPLLVAFVIDPDYPESSLRHHRFLVEGLSSVAPRLERRRAGLRVEIGSPPQVISRLAGRATELVTDRGYLRLHREWRQEVADSVVIPTYEVETNLVVPVEVTSNKQEYAARTIRPRVHRRLEDYLLEPHEIESAHDGRALSGGVDPDDHDRIVEQIDVDPAVPPSARFRGGEEAALENLDRFLEDLVDGYDEARGEPGVAGTSELSPYLHFGHLSPITVVAAARQATGGSGDGYETLVEELVVRRELSHNYTWFQPAYDSYASLPGWARQTLDDHRHDPRRHIYSTDQLEAAETHDPYWNAAMTEMRETGYMHNYMRMYWGKQIIFWTEAPEAAFETALYLNNRYFLDGRDPNSYAGVGWCFGLHDRAWPEREVIGKVRTMTAGGLERKKDMAAYLRRVEDLTGVKPAGSG